MIYVLFVFGALSTFTGLATTAGTFRGELVLLCYTLLGFIVMVAAIWIKMGYV